MTWLTSKDIETFINTKDYDIRKTGNARWIDQKCTADVLTICADCVCVYYEKYGGIEFTRTDIQFFDYTMKNVKETFKKPDTDAPLAANEYDKYFMQPLELLAYAGVLKKQKVGHRNFYKVEYQEMLEFLSLREKNSIIFLNIYISKVLRDSGIYSSFEIFFDNQTRINFMDMKYTFSAFTMQHTPINGAVECGRIFAKVLNPMAYVRNLKGTESGRMSTGKITLDMLMYNRGNFRDPKDKPKEMPRREYAETLGSSIINRNYTNYLCEKAKKFVKAFNDKFNDGRSEIFTESSAKEHATNMHHIFMISDFPQLSDYYENIIALTPTQHYNHAHPMFRTQELNKHYQYSCLLAKTETIRNNLEMPEDDQIYDYLRYTNMLYIGLNQESFLELKDNDFEGAVTLLNVIYL